MSKAILVIDMPNDCSHCPVSSISDYQYICDEMGRIMSEDEYYAQKPDWCPLKPMPQKIDIELLNNMCKHCESMINKCGKLCPYRSIDNDYCDEYEKLKGAIEQNEM